MNLCEIAKCEAIIKLISENLHKVDFGEFGPNENENLWIEKAQKRLCVVFPPSYIWWLNNYGGGEILGDEVFSVYELDYGTFKGGDIVYMNELSRKNGFTDNTQLVIQQNDQGEIFYFDLLHPDKNGEYPVYRAFGDIKVKYADDFLDFLAGRIQDKY